MARSREVQASAVLLPDPAGRASRRAGAAAPGKLCACLSARRGSRWGPSCPLPRICSDRWWRYRVEAETRRFRRGREDDIPSLQQQVDQQGGRRPQASGKRTDTDSWQAGLDPDGHRTACLPWVPPPVPVHEQQLRRRLMRVRLSQVLQQRDVDVGFAEGEVRVDVGCRGEVDLTRNVTEKLQTSAQHQLPIRWRRSNRPSITHAQVREGQEREDSDSFVALRVSERDVQARNGLQAARGEVIDIFTVKLSSAEFCRVVRVPWQRKGQVGVVRKDCGAGLPDLLTAGRAGQQSVQWPF